MDLTKAYDSVDRSTLVATLRHYGVTHQLADIVTDLYTETTCRVRASEGISEEFESRLESDRDVFCPRCYSTAIWITSYEKPWR